jgi:S-DNA-T family DNA segregation ATPase FtsK/SpoIIIE
MGSLAYTDGGQLSEYEIVSVKPGYFANQRNRTNTANKMVKSLDGDWFAEFDEVTDTCRMKLRIPFPAAIAPPRVRPAQTVEEAIARYLGTYWEFGVDAYGKHVRAKMTAVPHVALIAGTGGGKSTVARTLIGQYQPFFGILLFDGKQADYPKSLGRLPNIIALSKNAAEYVVYMRWLWDEMNERYVEADLRKDSGEAEASFDFPPLFALIDELPSLRGLVSKADPKDDCKTFDFYVNDLLQKGRQARIHLCLISQSLRKEAVPMWWQENIGQIAFLGRVSPRSLMSDAIPEEFRNIVSSMSQSIPSTDNERGRGVFLMKEEGAVQPVEFKSYFGWSEGSTSLEEALTEKVREAWEIAAKDAKSIISLYDRIGIKVEDPSWRTLPMEEMVETPTVVITDENGLIPGMSKYDPLSLEFLGNEKMVIGTRARGRGSVTRPAD